MRRVAVFPAAVLAAALLVQAQDDPNEALKAEIEHLTAVLRERARTAAPEEEKVPVLRIYEVGDLCTPIADEALQPTNLYPSAVRLQDEDVPGREPAPPFEIDQIIELIRGLVEPESWDIILGADIAPKNDRLFVNTLPRVHRGIERLLATLRAAAGVELSVEVAAVQVSPGQAALLADRPRELSEEEAAALRAGTLGAVELRVRDGRQVAGRSGGGFSYLQDYDVSIAQGAAIATPVRKELFDGCAAEVRAFYDAAASGALLHLRAERTRISKPPRTLSTEHGPLELPQMQLTRLETALWVPLGRTVVAGGGTRGGTPCVFLVTARKVE